MDEPQHLHLPSGDFKRLLWLDMFQNMAEFQFENQKGAHPGPDSEALQGRSPPHPCEQREAHFKSEDPHSENDICGGGRLHNVLDSLLLCPDVVCMGPCSTKRR